MPEKGISGLYEYCCEGKFYDWHITENQGEYRIREGSVCSAPICYKGDEILKLEEASYQSIEEEKSTFTIVKDRAGSRRRLPHRPYKTFQLEADDDLMVLKGKNRPVITIKKVLCDWRFPNTRFASLWLCLPIYSYRDRHSQPYVIEDQKLNVPHRFYFPSGIPGLEREGAGLINELQCIPEKNLIPYNAYCDIGETGIDRPVVLTNDAFQVVIGHVAKLFPGVDIFGDSITRYNFFKGLMLEQIPIALAGRGTL